MANNGYSDIRNNIQRKQRMKMPSHKQPESKDKNVRDSPYVSNYPSKISKRKSKDERGSRESLSKVSKKKEYRFKRNSKRSKNDIFAGESGKSHKQGHLKNNTNTMSKKIKVKSVSQNRTKKPKKQNFNQTFKESDLIDSIIKFSNPVKNSQTKLNQTMALYNQNKYYAQQNKHSTRDYFNQVNNSRASKKKSLNYMKNMMNKTVLIQNQDYQVLGKSIQDRVPKKYAQNNAYVIPSQGVVSYFCLNIKLILYNFRGKRTSQDTLRTTICLKIARLSPMIS